MKFLAVFCILTLVVLETVVSQGIPTRKCPPGEHSVLYCPRVHEATCTSPQRPGFIGACDIPDCFCDQGTIRDGSGRCVNPSQC